MKTIIPLLANDTSDDAEKKRRTLQAAMPEYDIRLHPDMPAEDRLISELAIVENPSAEVLDAYPNLKWVHSLWAGVEKVLDAFSSRDIKVVRMTDPELAHTMAEAVLAWTMYLHREMPLYRAQQAASQWHQQAYVRPEDRHITFLGMGKLGAAAADALRQRGFPVSGWSRTAKSIHGVDMYHGDAGLNTCLGKADILILLLPLTGETRGLLNARTLAMMRPQTQVINFARGPIIKDDDLLDALDRGHIRHAVLDVFATEPLPAEHPYWHHPSVTALPHISAPTNMETASVIVADNIRSYDATGLIPAHVDPQSGY